MAQVKSIRPDGTKRIQEICDEPTKTQQNHTDECDVNKIIAKYKKTGSITHISRRDGSYIDISNIPDYHTALLTVLDAQTAFKQLPAQLRLRFDNDPGKLVAFMQDKNNLQEAISLGLVDPPKKTKHSSTKYSNSK